jgi:formate--tetrahydrofolate ligase
MDLNDRSLRKIEIGLSGEKNIVPREDGFDITVASEIMAIFCLAKDLKDLENRIGKITVGYDKDGKPITAHDLKAEGAMTVLLKDAFNPNLVQTLEGTPAIVHGGPFANIAHGCNSVIATKLAMKLADYTITEAGFGADLGAEKFLDIKTKHLPKCPDAAVCVATIKALKYHGGMDIKEIANPSIEYLERGIHNLLRHVDNIKNKFGINVIVAINKFNQDTEEEIKYLEEKLKEQGVNMSLVEAWGKGGEGAKDLATKVVELCSKGNNFKYIYNEEDSLKEKIEKIATKIYGATGVEYLEDVTKKLEEIEKLGYKNFPVCIAKTQYSFSDDAKNLECLEPFKIHVKNVILKTGAGFVVVLTGDIFTMPGLPKSPASERIFLNQNGEIEGIF